ncbi:MAG: ATP-binding cassette domain-containing protein [Lachnospiraceae bacterium]
MSALIWTKVLFGILGASGCGKSMTLKCIAGILRPDEGKIILNGRSLFDSEKKIDLKPQKRRVGYLFSGFCPFSEHDRGRECGSRSHPSEERKNKSRFAG